MKDKEGKIRSKICQSQSGQIGGDELKKAKTLVVWIKSKFKPKHRDDSKDYSELKQTFT